jgi:GNAT superfamily N-acetyltransferase
MILPATAPANAIATALEENLCSYAAVFGGAPQAEIGDYEHSLWVITRIPTLPFTGILRPYFGDGSVAEAVSTIMRHFQQRQARPSWIFNPLRAAPDLTQHLAAHQLQRTADIPGMAIDLQSMPAQSASPCLRIVSLADTTMLTAWARVYAISNGTPDWIQPELCELFAAVLWAQDALRLYLAYLDDQPVATAATFCSAGVVGLYEVATLPDVQRRGIGGSLTRHALVEARRQGYTIGALLSSAMAEQLYRQLGFQEYCRLHIYN